MFGRRSNVQAFQAALDQAQIDCRPVNMSQLTSG
jgi:hypothetical protein